MRDSTPMWAKWVRTLVEAQIVQHASTGAQVFYNVMSYRAR